MKPKTSTEFVPTALRQVWDWKESVYQETKHLSTHEALDYILEQGGAIARQLNLRVAVFPDNAPPVAKVAETPAKYRAKRKNRAAGSS
jgi:hypothetical protein